MRKSFKKVVACLLAVLMVTFSVPFTALATPDDYKPNFTLQFNTFVADDSFDAEGITSTKWGMKTPAYDLQAFTVLLLITRVALTKKMVPLKSQDFILKTAKFKVSLITTDLQQMIMLVK